MTSTIDRPRISTLNEIVGSEQATCDIGGAWIVYAPEGHVTCVTSNRQAAEDAVYSKAAEGNLDPKDFRVEVWHIYEQWQEDDTDRVAFTLRRDLAEQLSQQLIERMLWLEANPDVGSTQQLQNLRYVWESISRSLLHLGLPTSELVARVKAGTLSRSRAAEELNISEWEFADRYGL